MNEKTIEPKMNLSVDYMGVWYTPAEHIEMEKRHEGLVQALGGSDFRLHSTDAWRAKSLLEKGLMPTRQRRGDKTVVNFCGNWNDGTETEPILYSAVKDKDIHYPSWNWIYLLKNEGGVLWRPHFDETSKYLVCVLDPQTPSRLEEAAPLRAGIIREGDLRDLDRPIESMVQEEISKREPKYCGLTGTHKEYLRHFMETVDKCLDGVDRSKSLLQFVGEQFQFHNVPLLLNNGQAFDYN